MADHDRVDSLALSRYLITSLILDRSEHAPIKTGPALATIWLQAAFGGFYVCCAYLFPKIHPLCHFFSHDLIASQLRPSLHELRTTISATQPSVLYRKKEDCSSDHSIPTLVPDPITSLFAQSRPQQAQQKPPKRKKRPQTKSSNRRFRLCLSQFD